MAENTKEAVKNAWNKLKNIGDAETVFDLCIWGSYLSGYGHSETPVDESREIYWHLKKLIIEEYELEKSKK